MTSQLDFTKERLAKSRAFGEGSDARLAGKPLTACPYPPGDQMNYWVLGWRHLAREWGLDAKWPVRELPRVRYGEVG